MQFYLFSRYAALTTLLCSSVAAVPSDPALLDAAPIVQVLPEARELPAPEWLVPGTRISFQGIASATGGGAQGAVIQYDIVSADADQVLAQATTWGDVGAGVVATGSNAVIGYPGMGSFWINPKALAGAESKANDNLSIVRAENNGVEVMRFQSDSPSGRSVLEYDTSTGLRVLSAQTTQNGASQEGYLSTRTLPKPWSGVAPGFVRYGTVLEYTGVQTSSNAPGVQTAMSYRVEFVETGSTFSLLNVYAQHEHLGQAAWGSVTGAQQFLGAYWLPAAAAEAELPSDPTVIDTDPLTGATTSVHRENNEVVVQVNATGYAWYGIYDELGVLSRFGSAANVAPAVVSDEFTLSGGSDLAALNEEPLPNDDAGDDDTGDDDSGDDDSGDDDSGDDDTGDDDTGDDDTGDDDAGDAEGDSDDKGKDDVDGDGTDGDNTATGDRDETGGDETDRDETDGDETDGDETDGDETDGDADDTDSADSREDEGAGEAKASKKSAAKDGNPDDSESDQSPGGDSSSSAGCSVGGGRSASSGPWMLFGLLALSVFGRRSVFGRQRIGASQRV